MSYVGNKPAQTTIPADDAVTTAMLKDDAVTAAKIEDSVNTEISANTAKVTNATHTGDVTGATALTIAAGAVDVAMLSATGSASSSTVLYGDGTWKAEPTTDTSGLEDDIALLGFRVASNGSLAKYNLVDQIVDDFQDASGVDASASTNQALAGGAYSGAIGNYYGDASDGSLSTAGNVTYTVLNKNGSYDGDMVVKQYSSLTINTGHTVTVDQQCRGLFIMVSGDCTINGTLSMDGKGASADPTASGGSDSNAVGASGLQVGYITSGGSSSFTNDGTGFNGSGTAIRTALANNNDLSSNGTIFTISRDGASGGSGGSTPYSQPATAVGGTGGAGTTGGTTLSTGGGAGGGARAYSASGSAGAKGGAFGGGPGGGGTQRPNAAGPPGAPTVNTPGGAQDYGGAGGNARNYGPSGGYWQEGGGAGNPGGTGGFGGSSGGTGVGGGIWLVVGGDLTIGATGVITADGVAGGAASSGGGGGGSGGGYAMVLYIGTLSNSGAIAAAGGAGGASGGDGGVGGAGGVDITQLSEIVQDMTLVSTATTAEVAPTKGDIVITYTNAVGTATLGTDLTLEFSADDGSNWTDFGIGPSASQGTTGGHTIVSKHDVALTSTSGTSMRWRVKTLNQSAARSTKIQAVSLGWS